MSLSIVLIDMVKILMVPVKKATLGLLKLKLFWNKYYDVIYYVHDYTKKKLSIGSNHIVDEIMWPKFGIFSISMREVVKTSISQEFDRKNHFILMGGLGSSSIILDWH